MITNTHLWYLLAEREDDWMVEKKVVMASLHAIESNGEVNDRRDPIEVYAGGIAHSIEKALVDFVTLEPSYPKELRLILQDGTAIYIRHQEEGKSARDSGIEIVL